MIDGIKSIILIKEGLAKSEFKIINDDGFNMYFNNEIKRLNNDLMLYFLDKFFRIIADWKNEYINNNGIDYEYWDLKIEYSDNSIKEYKGRGMYPNNFIALENLIFEIYDK